MPLRIAIAVVEWRGRFLVGTRPAGATFAGLAEFPGGKCEGDESFEACAVRETAEETALAVVPTERITEKAFESAYGRRILSFWRCRLADESTAAVPTPPFRWVSREELSALTFPPANDTIVAGLIGPTTELGA